ncbi:MAG: hypothetical protein Q9227_008904 [Pyrenula ochraceoflavens]
MALACLFAQLRDARHQYSFPQLDLQAFIVDHRTREESAEEATLVASWLDAIDIPSQILKMHWDAGVDPMMLPGFETQARKKRFDLIQSASYSRGITNLYLGHHRGDQVETIMMRLFRNHSIASLGLIGIRPVSVAPGLDDALGQEARLQRVIPVERGLDYISNPPEVNDCQGLIDVAPRIYLNRPLLRFMKDELIATCSINGVKYVTDKTNLSPLLTERNAVRHLLATYQLPRAIQANSLLRLAEVAYRSSESLIKTSEIMMSKTRLVSFDLRSGTLIIQLPSQGDSVWDMVDFRTFRSYLTYLLNFVCPCNSQSRSSGWENLAVARLVHPHLRQKGALPTKFEESFNVDGTIILCSKSANDEQVQVVFSRQPPRKSKVLDSKVHFSFRQSSSTWSNWELFDGRFLVRVHRPSSGDDSRLGMRYLTRQDLSRLQKDPLPSPVKVCVKDNIAPLPNRCHLALPVIYDTGKAEDDLPLAIPTFGLCIKTWSGESRSLVTPDFEVCYKNIDFEALRHLLPDYDSVSTDRHH